MNVLSSGVIFRGSKSHSGVGIRIMAWCHETCCATRKYTLLVIPEVAVILVAAQLLFGCSVGPQYICGAVGPLGIGRLAAEGVRPSVLPFRVGVRAPWARL